MEKEMFSLTREDIWDPDLPSVAAPSLLQGKKMRSCISERLSGSEKTPVTFDDCLCPFSVSTWHLGNLQKHVVSEGCLSSAIAASASVPLLFAPVKMNGDEHTLVDGALGDPTGLGCCRAIPSSGRVLHIGFPGEVPGFRGVGCPSFLDPKLVPSSACIDMVSVVLEKSPNVNIFKMKEEGPKASLLANKSIKALLDRPMTPPVITEATKERCQSKLRVIRASPPVENEGGILNWFRKRALGILNGPYPPPTDDDERETMRDGDEVGERDADEEAPLKRQRTVS